jgi:hypothetical protein
MEIMPLGPSDGFDAAQCVEGIGIVQLACCARTASVIGCARFNVLLVPTWISLQTSDRPSSSSQIEIQARVGRGLTKMMRS